MANKQTAASPFKSMYGGGFISAQQLLAEIICSRQARSKGKDLPDKFWNLPEWERGYLIQIRLALGLLKLYSAETILKVLRGPDGRTAYSLNAKWLDGPFKTEKAKLEKQKQTETKRDKPTVAPTQTTTEQFVGEESEMSKLRDL